MTITSKEFPQPFNCPCCGKVTIEIAPARGAIKGFECAMGHLTDVFKDENGRLRFSCITNPDWKINLKEIKKEPEPI